MAGGLSRGEIWLCEFPAPDKRRPVLVISRQALLGVMPNAIVVPITRTIRGVASEVVLGVEDGLKAPSCANLVAIETVQQSRLQRFVGVARPEKMIELCSALAYVSGCR